MNKTARYIFIILGILVLLFVLWFFKSIVAYILISLVLSLLGKPIVDMLLKLKIKKFRLPVWLCALASLVMLWIAFYAFFRIFVPIVVNEAEYLSGVKIQTLITSLEEPIDKVEIFLNKFRIEKEENLSLAETLSQKLSNLLSISTLSDILGSLANLLGNVFIALFSITFITFFFLKDDKMFINAIQLVIPEKHSKAFEHAMVSVKSLLMRYFVGLLGQITEIMILVTLGLTLVGVGFQHSLVIGLLAGFFNIIPYLGPLISSIFGTILGMVIHIDKDLHGGLLPMAGYMIVVFIIVHLIDNLIYQPLIFSKSINAHPMEVFLVILIAGHLAGVIG
ncbi:MAG: AI-2E family transporter, partial [Bacteroidales bacterium]|nr:AI-2E family transporter [Bacteroidales bacterium]